MSSAVRFQPLDECKPVGRLVPFDVLSKRHRRCLIARQKLVHGAIDRRFVCNWPPPVEHKRVPWLMRALAGIGLCDRIALELRLQTERSMSLVKFCTAALLPTATAACSKGRPPQAKSLFLRADPAPWLGLPVWSSHPSARAAAVPSETYVKQIPRESGRRYASVPHASADFFPRGAKKNGSSNDWIPCAESSADQCPRVRA